MKSPNLHIQINPLTNGMPEVPAQFPGGILAYHNFLKNHLVYPFNALENGVEGAVTVGFTITKDGIIKASKIIKSLHVECNQEALRLVAAMPNWTPAKNAGANVSVQVELPIYFQLANVPSEYA